MNRSRRYKFTNILNCRDLGGYETEYGVTRYGRFIRCGVVEVPNDTEIRLLKEMGVKTVIDLRGDYEQNNMPLMLERCGAQVQRISLYEANVANANPSNITLAQTYIEIVDNYRENMRAVLEACADAQGETVMYHCFFGKDRTGILTMLLLTIAGVDEDDIIADYQVTYTYLRRYIDEHEKTLWCKDRKLLYSLPETLIELIEHMNEKYGSVYDYILSTGISREKLEKIRKRFFADL